MFQQLKFMKAFLTNLSVADINIVATSPTRGDKKQVTYNSSFRMKTSLTFEQARKAALNEVEAALAKQTALCDKVAKAAQ